MSPKITIGMAHYDDYEGMWSTVQSVFLHNEWESPDDVEIVIVDTSPVGSDHRRLTQDFINKGGNLRKGARTPLLRYVDASKLPPGTTQSRNMIFQYATAPVVCVMDCHVMLRINTLLKLSVWFDQHSECEDLIHGPMLYDNLDAFSTHFSDQFRGGMWGTWGTAWKSPKGEIFVCENEEISDTSGKRESDGQVHYRDLMTLKLLPTQANGQSYLPTGEVLPFLSWAGHEQPLRAAGFQHLGHGGEGEPFEIPGCGMGLFASRRDSWLGFNKDCTGFGGEEMNIHTKYRQAGRKAICLPWLEWNHRFGRAGGAPYPIPHSAKVRNYVLWANELGNPANEGGIALLDRIHTHFVDGKSFSEVKWQELLADPVNFKVDLKPQTRNIGGPALDTLFQEVATKARDLSEHAEKIRDMTSKVQSVTAFVKRADWETLLAAGFPNTLTIYQSEESHLIQMTHEAVSKQDAKDNRKISTYQTHHKGAEVDPLKVDQIPLVDMLVIDKENSATYLMEALTKHGPSVQSAIMIRGTESFGEKAEGIDAPGLWYAMKEWMVTHPEWFILQHWPNQYGLTLMAKDPIARPEREVRPWPKGYGPGTELKAILGSVGLNPAPGCSCNSRMKQMDEWGVEECVAQKETIVQWLIEGAESWGWTKAAANKTPDGEEHKKLTLAEKALIGWKSITTGIAFKVDWTNPYPGLVNEAIKRSEEKEAAVCEGSCETCDKPGCKKNI